MLQSAAAIAVPGNPTGTIAQKGYFNGPGAGTIEEEIDARLGTETPVIVSALLDTTALGNPVYVLSTAWGDQLDLDFPIDDLMTLDANWQGAMRRGLSIAHSVVSTVAALTGIDFATAGVDGGWAAIHVRAIVGTATNATFTVQSSTVVGFGSPVTHGTFTVSAVGAQMLTFTGAVGRYVRLNCTSLGGATSLAVTASAGVTGVTGR
ncbi:MAG: hypothetical protein IPM07_26340 [Anaerolineales bacterium]|nr:hypothetical protein [Anaerolineales bacterium]